MNEAICGGVGKKKSLLAAIKTQALTCQQHFMFLKTCQWLQLKERLKIDVNKSLIFCGLISMVALKSRLEMFLVGHSKDARK